MSCYQQTEEFHARDSSFNHLGRITRGVGRDVLDVRPDGVHGATIVAGRYVRPGTFLGVRQQALFQSERDEASSEGQSTEVEVEHELLDWLLINLQGGTSSARVHLRTRYSY